MTRDKGGPAPQQEHGQLALLRPRRAEWQHAPEPQQSRRLPGSLIGENIGWGSGGYATPRQTVITWMNTRRHRRNILDRSFRDGGFGVVLGVPSRDGPGATYVTTFGKGR